MAMTRKQLKALRRHKSIVKKRNIRTNNKKQTIPFLRLVFGRQKSRTYRLYDI